MRRLDTRRGRPKILFLITRSEAVGGAHIHVRDMAFELAARGMDVAVAVGGGGVYLDMLRKAEIRVISVKNLVRSINPIRDFLCFFEFGRILRNESPDIVSIHSSKAGIVGRLVCGYGRVPNIFTAHGWSFTDGVGYIAGIVYRYLECWAARYATLIVTVCESDAEMAMKAKVTDDNKLRVVHNGMPLLKMSEADPMFNPVTIVMTARLDQQKDHATLFAALLALEGLPWRLQLVGDGPLLHYLKTLATKLGLSKRIEFLGRRDDVSQILADAQIFVLCSNWEGFPRSILEAMRAGLPVISTRVAGTPESVEHGVTGFLVERGNHEDLATCLALLINDPALRQSMGQASRRRFTSHFTFKQMFNRTIHVYDEALSIHGQLPMFSEFKFD